MKSTNADLILTGGIVVTANPRWEVFDPGAVAVRDDSLVAVGPADAIAQAYTAAETMDCSGKALIPGMVNAHTHVPMTLMRGMADDLRLDVWLMGYMMPVEREFVSPEFCYLGAQLACAEMLRSGITCFADMYYYEEDVARAVAEAGLRAMCGQTILKFPSPDADSYEDGLARAQRFIETWQGHPLIVPCVAPHAPYTSTADMLRACTELASEYDVPVHIHLSESTREIENMRQEYGMGVIDWVERQSLFKAKVTAAHCVHLTEPEIASLHRHNAGVAHCPTSNLKLASGIAPTVKMLAAGVNVGIGTDGPASNNDLDMFEETRLAALMPKGFGGDPTALPAREAFGMATIYGAKAIHLDHLTGSLEPGKRADLALLNLNPAHNSPAFRRDTNAIYSQLVYAAKSGDVTDVMANGRWLMREQNLLTLNEADIIRQASEYSRRIDIFLIEREQSVLRKLVDIGGLEYKKSFEIQVKAGILNPEKILTALESGQIDITDSRHYRQHDIYFLFNPPEENRLRIRQTSTVGDDGQAADKTTKLMLIGPAREFKIGTATMLSRTRFSAPSPHTQRFYGEYFKPAKVIEIKKDRRKWPVIYQGVEFEVNLDLLIKPELGCFVEIKRSSWSRQEARTAAPLVSELLQLLGVSPKQATRQEYVEMATLRNSVDRKVP